MNIILIIILIVYILINSFIYYLKWLNISYLRKNGTSIPPEFEGYIDKDLLIKTSNYTIDNNRFNIIYSIFNNILLIIFLFCGLLDVYNNWIESFNLSFILSGILFFLLLSYAGTIIHIPFNLYEVFKIENKYGFNTTTIKLWITDLIKSLVISTILISLLFVCCLFIIKTMPSWWWLFVWIFFFIFSIFLMYISPYVIEPLFNKFEPINDEKLAESIKNIAQKAGVTVSKILKVDESKRSKHSNAYFTGIGKVKRIVLYDTLLANMNHDEILSVLAHEIGHWKKRHILKRIIFSEIISFVVLYIAFLLLKLPLLADIFNLDSDNLFAKVIILGFIGSLVSFPFMPVANYFSRKNEIEADRYGFELIGETKSLITALVKLSKDNLSNLHPHPFYSKFYYSHPPIVQRINYLKEWEKSVSEIKKL